MDNSYHIYTNLYNLNEIMQFFCWMAEVGLNLRTSSALTLLLSRAMATLFVLQCSELSRSNGDSVGRDSYFNKVKTDQSEYCHEMDDCQVMCRLHDVEIKL